MMRASNAPEDVLGGTIPMKTQHANHRECCWTCSSARPGRASGRACYNTAQCWSMTNSALPARHSAGTGSRNSRLSDCLYSQRARANKAGIRKYNGCVPLGHILNSQDSYSRRVAAFEISDKANNDNLLSHIASGHHTTLAAEDCQTSATSEYVYSTSLHTRR